MAPEEPYYYRNLRRKVKDWADSSGGSLSRWNDLIFKYPDLVHLMCRLSFDSRLETKHKARLAPPIAYLIAPDDFIPEGIIGPVGYTDDLVAAALVLKNIMPHIPQECLNEHWMGPGDLHATIDEALVFADEMVGDGLWKHLKVMFGE